MTPPPPQLTLAVPAVLNVGCCAPQVSDGACPQPGLGGAPFADAEDDRSARGFECFAHEGVGGFAVLIWKRIAPVFLQIIDSPGGVLSRILVLVADAARPLGAGHRADVGVDSELQALGMNVVGQCLDAGGELLRVDDDVAFGIAAGLPAVIDDDVLISCVLHTVGGHLVGCLAHDLLVQTFAGKFVPAVPPHRRGSRQTIVERNARRRNTHHPYSYPQGNYQLTIHSQSPSFRCALALLLTTQAFYPFETGIGRGRVKLRIMSSESESNLYHTKKGAMSWAAASHRSPLRRW